MSDADIVNGLLGYRKKRDGEREAQVGELSRSLTESLGTNPDEFAADKLAARDLGLPVDLVKGRREDFEFDRRMKQIDPNTLVDTAPATARVLSDPETASAAHDDVENMWLYERWWAEVGQRFQRGRDIVELGNLGRKAALGMASDHDEMMIRILQSREMKDYGIEGEGVAGWLIGVPGATAEMLPMAFDSIKHRAVGAVVGGAAGLVTTGPGGIFTAAGGQAVGGFVSAFDTEYGNAYLELRDVEGTDPALANGLALAVGTVNGLLEGTGMGAIFKNAPLIGSVIKTGSRSGIKKLLTEPILKHTFGRAGEIVGRASATEFATEMAQELTLIGATLYELGKQGKGLEDFTVSAEDEHGNIVTLYGVAAVWKRALDAGIAGSQGGAGLSTAGQAGRGIAAIAEPATAPIYKKLSDIVDRSEYRKRDKEGFRKFVREQIDNEESVLPENVTIRGDGIRRYFSQPEGDDQGDGEGSADQDAAAKRKALEDALRAFPELQAELDQSAVTGADVTIPYDVYEAYLAGEEFAEEMGARVLEGYVGARRTVSAVRQPRERAVPVAARGVASSG